MIMLICLEYAINYNHVSCNLFENTNYYIEVIINKQPDFWMQLD